MSETLAKLVSSLVLIVVACIALYHACIRAATIYLFELDTKTVIFVNFYHVICFPIFLSGFLVLVYIGTRRDIERRDSLAKLVEEAKVRSRTDSTIASRKVSRTGDSTRRTSFSYTDDMLVDQARRLSKLLSNIEEQDTVRGSQEEEDDDNRPPTPTPAAPIPPRFTVDKVDTLLPKFLPPDEGPRPRSFSNLSRLHRKLVDDSRKSSICESECLHEDTRDIYREISETNFQTLLLSAFNITARIDDQNYLEVQRNPMDVLGEICAIHVPIWLCVFSFYVTLLDICSIKLADVFFHHEALLTYGALGLSIAFGVIHGVWGNWITNNVLAFSSIYIVISRCQPISYQVGVGLLLGMLLFDLFWMCVIDLLSTVAKESRGPFMIIIPRNRHGEKQRLATLDVMVPGIFLNLVLKYSSMYDPKLFDLSFYAVLGGLTATMFISIMRKTITPAMVLPGLAAVAVSLGCTVDAKDLWRFMIKH